MTKLVISPTLRVGESKDDQTLGASGPSMWWNRFLMERLLWGCWWTTCKLDELGKYVEVIRICFERNGTDPRAVLTDIAFEVVIVDPASGNKETKVILRCALETLRRKDGAEIVGDCLLDSIRADFVHRVKRMQREADQLGALLCFLNGILIANRAEIDKNK